MSTFQHFSNTVIFKKSPNSCSQPAFLASSIRHNAKTQQKECLLIVYTHHVYKTCTLFLVDSSRGSTTSSAFHFHRFSKGLGYSKLAVSQSNHKSTMTRSSLLLCVASPRQHFVEHNVFILYAPLDSAGSFLWCYDLKEFFLHSMQKVYILHVYPWSLLWRHSGKWCCDASLACKIQD